MQFRLNKPKYFFFLGGAILAILLLSELMPVRPARDVRIEPGTAHRAGRSRDFSLTEELWQSDPQRARSILIGMEAFYQTKKFAPDFVGNALACTQCHFGGGRQSGMLGLIGVAATYPRWDFRSQKKIDLTQRVQSCFLRSENGSAPPADAPVLRHLLDYLQALSWGVPAASDAYRNDFVKISASKLISIPNLSPERGQQLYAQRCASCHMETGAGDGWAPPLWGENSFNDGAGLARVYTLASFLYDSMPLSDPGHLTEEEAQQIAAYLDAQERPVYSRKELDFQDGKIPDDAVYYRRRYPQNPLKQKLFK